MTVYRKYGKRLIDVVFSTLSLLLLAVPLVIVTYLVQSRLGRPVLFRQWRPGFNCKLFELIKFRTMTSAKDSDGKLLSDAERLTPLGKFLRKTSIDELPELWNVFKGDMSLVGPRPLLSEYLPHYTYRETKRHAVLPGLTGLAQVSGRNYLSWDERLELDAFYTENVSFKLDIWILWRTIKGVIRQAGVSADTSQIEPNLALLRTNKAQKGAEVDK